MAVATGLRAPTAPSSVWVVVMWSGWAGLRPRWLWMAAVTRSSTANSLEGVELILVPPGLKQTTAEDGETIFADLKSGRYVIAVNTRSLPDKMTLVGDRFGPGTAA